MTGHLVPLPGTDWSVWRWALLRTAGFPADGLDLFAAPECAEVADRLLAGVAGEDEYDKALHEAELRSGRAVYDLAGDPLLREAVTWQNTTALHALDGLRRSGPVGARNYRRRHREELVARYWQRYCGKNETVGFFGPVCWTTVDPDAPAAVTARPGPGLVRYRAVFLEHWALTAFCDGLAADPALRPALPVTLAPQLTLDGRTLHRVAQPPLTLSPAEAAVLSRCDGRRSAAEVAADAAADPGAGVHKPADALLVLERLAERAVVTWGIDPPRRYDADRVVRAVLTDVAPSPARDAALAGLDRLVTARDGVAAAAGDPDALHAALARLDEEFTAVTGSDARRREGQMYAGRTPCHEETVRDLDVVLGAPVLAALAAPLAVLLRAARWLTAEIARVYDDALRAIHAELAAEVAGPGGAATAAVPLAEVWYLAQGSLFGAGERPVDAVEAEFARRWSVLFGLDRVAPGTSRVTLAADDLADAVAEAFPADRPGWAAGRLHSPDLHLCARDVDALAAGDFTAVLGEMHAAWATFDTAVFGVGQDHVGELRAALREDLGPGRVLLAYPADFPRYTGRIARFLDDPSDRELAWAPAPGVDPARRMPVTAGTVSVVDGRLVADTPDGTRRPLAEVFAGLLSMHAADAFKLAAAAPHTPRVTIDRLTVARETWRTTVGATGLVTPADDRARYLAGRRWRAALGLPEHVFVKLGTETKPFYVDLTSPLHVASLAGMVRSAHLRGGDGVGVVVSELLPGPADAWVPDAAGRRYSSEIRLQAVDAAHAPGTEGEGAR